MQQNTWLSKEQDIGARMARELVVMTNPAVLDAVSGGETAGV
jgi:hypothetical protein